MFLSFVNHFPTQCISFLVKSIQSHWHNLVVEVRLVGHFHTDVVVGKAVHQRLARRGMFEQHRPRGADEPAVEVVSLLRRKSEDTLTALVLFLRRDHMRDFQGFGASPFGVGEDVILGYIDTLHEVIGFLKILLCLATSAYDDIHTDESIGHHGAYLLYLMGEKGCVVLAVHKPQHLIATTLQGDVEMRHESPRLHTVLDDFIGQQVRLDARDAVAFNAVYLVKSLDEIESVLACVFAEVANVHPCDYYLLAATLGHILCLCHQALDGAAAAASACQWNGAVAAVVVTAVLDLEEIACAVATFT